MRLTLTQKVTLLSALCVVVTSLLVGAGFLHQASTLVQERTTTALHTSLLQRADEMSRSLQQYQSDIRFLALLPALDGYLLSMQAGGKSPRTGLDTSVLHGALSAILRARLQAIPEYFQLRVIDNADHPGMELLRVERNGKNIREVPAAFLQDKSDRYYFKATQQLKQGEIYASPIDLNQEHGEIETEQVRTLRLAMPVGWSNGKALGLLVININVATLLDRSVVVHDPFFITNASGDYLYHPNPAYRFAFEKGESHRLQDDMPAYADWFQGPQYSQLNQEVHYQGNDYYASLVKVYLPGSDRHSFLTLTQLVPFVSMTDALQQLLLNAGLWFFAVLLLGTTACILLMRRSLLPLVAMSSWVQRYAEGEYNLPHQPMPHDEIGTLYNGLRRLGQTLRKRERALHANEVKLQTVLDTVISGILTITEKGTIESANAAAEQLFGYRNNAMVGLHIRILMPESSAERHDELFQRYLTDGHSDIIGLLRHVTARHRDGHEFPVCLSINDTWHNNQRLFVVGIQDLSALQEAEKMNARLGRLIQASSNEILILDSDFHLLELNHSAMANLGYSSSHVINDLYAIVAPHALEQTLQSLRSLLQRRGLDTQFESYFKRADGTSYPVEIRAFLLHDKEQTRWALLAQDISERQQQHRTLNHYVQQLEVSNRELVEFTSLATTNLQQPVQQAMRLLQQLLETNPALQQRLPQPAQQLRNLLQGMDFTLRELLLLNRMHIRPTNPVRLDLNQLVDEVLHELQERLQLARLRVHLQPLPTLQADREQMMQLLRELLHAALLACHPELPNEVYLHALGSDVCATSETGFALRGAFAPVMESIGMVLCRRIVARHQGHLRLQLNGSDSEIRICLPNHHSLGPAASEPPASHTQPSHNPIAPADPDR